MLLIKLQPQIKSSCSDLIWILAFSTLRLGSNPLVRPPHSSLRSFRVNFRSVNSKPIYVSKFVIELVHLLKHSDGPETI